MVLLFVFISGGHSVGKTTLIKEVTTLLEEKEKKILNIRELGRKTLQTLRMTRDDFQDQEKRRHYQRTLLEEQMKAEQQMEKENSGVLQDDIIILCDRSALDGFTYSKMYAGSEFYEELVASKEAQDCLNRYKTHKTMHILVQPHPITFKDDNVRMKPDLKELEHWTEIFKEIANEVDIPITGVIDTPDLKQRGENVLKMMELNC